MDPPVPMESLISNTAEDERPRVGMVFQSLEEAEKSYTSYATSKGFRVRIQKTNDKLSNTIKRRAIICANGGHCATSPIGPPKKLQKVSQNNCKARMVITLQQDGSFLVSEFKDEHNHALPSPVKVLPIKLKLSRNRQADQVIGQIDSTDGAGVGSSSILPHTGPSIAPLSSCKRNEQGRPKETVAEGRLRAMLEEIDRCLKADPDQVRAFEEFISGNHVPEGIAFCWNLVHRII